MEEIEKKEEIKQVKIHELTDQNLLFLKHLQAGLTVKEAYKLAGYQGESANAPYALYSQLKKTLQDIVDANGLDALRLRMEMQKIMSLPLKDATISARDKIKAIEVTHKVLNGQMDQSKLNMTAFVINRYEKQEPKQVIEAEEIKDNESH